MNVSRRSFLEALGGAGAAMALPGCCGMFCGGGRYKAKIALQLYSIHQYIAKVGFAKALADVAGIGFVGVEFAGYGKHTPAEIRKMLADTGLAVCGTHVSNDRYGFEIDAKAGKYDYDPEVLKQTCEFELGYGNSLVICPGGGNIPPGCSWDTGRGGTVGKPSKEIDEFTKRLCELYNKAAVDAKKLGCKIGLHNHTWEHGVKMTNGQSFWDYFFSNTSQDVCMEQDVGWSTCAGVDPKAEFRKYPGRSPTLHAKENGMGKDVKEFDAILGQPGKPGAVPVDWDGLIPAADEAGVEWWVVECERHFEDLSAITPSYAFLKAKGLN